MVRGSPLVCLEDESTPAARNPIRSGATHAQDFHRHRSRRRSTRLSCRRPDAAHPPRSVVEDEPGDFSQARGLSADRILQDSRRDERRRPAHARRSWPRASGRSARATPRRAWRSPRVRRARARRSWSWRARRPPSSRPSSGSARRSSRRRSTKRWKAVEAHQSDRMTGRMVHPFDDDDFISGNGTAGSRFSRTCRTSMPSWRRWAAAVCSPASAS